MSDGAPMRALAAPLALLFLLAGCMEAQETPESSGTPASGDARLDADTPFAFHVWEPCTMCAGGEPDGGRLYLFLHGGDVVRAGLVAAGDVDADARAAAEWEAASEALTVAGHPELAPLAPQRKPADPQAIEELRRALNASWDAPRGDPSKPCARPCPGVFGRSADGWTILRVGDEPAYQDASNADFVTLLRAFLQAESAFEPLTLPSLPPTMPTHPVSPKPIPPEPAPPTAAWHGQDNEFGSIRSPYQDGMGEGERAIVEARVVLRELYKAKDARFFMFALDVEGTGLDVEFADLQRMDTGAEIPCYQREGSPTTSMKCFVEVEDMPPAGTEIVMAGNVGASRSGTFNVGAIVVPYTDTWMRVQMSNGLDAELYAGTQMTVDDARPAGEGNLTAPAPAPTPSPSSTGNETSPQPS